MRYPNMRQAKQAVRAIERRFPDSDCKILDWRDSGYGIRILPQAMDPYTIAMEDIPGLPKGTFLEPGYGSLGLYFI
ncbi:hypothetical protein C731_2990 [Mycolicibacterium hassiacum DSM 44199]|uniref:Uncharacterized protein n=1 Tax=Mycolicibacterium hassiacum (strain DSM 44199 / CIP 105218 / JCM 12690 / 3849) TaxID=1122247 RepID=K5BEF9_MYCHD|nr:hypothetical protein [Mycolicibacterium hassiacum]EKF22987.1 hypothetical protein C731_2990 [Mycolicibacterium hassiacum DSM 44199]VCT89480.1 hypothetical protein MHAS_01174 [Mycolicibacterium hassiacum DSM 44199]